MKAYCVHTLAEKYLRDLKRGNPHFYAAADNPDVLPVAESLTHRVVLMREQAPNYLVGFKASGLPVFTHDIKLASAHDADSLKLVEVLSQLETHNISVETMPATWFSNYQNE